MDYLSMPMPVLWLLLIGLLCWRWQVLSRRLMLLGTLILLVFSLPVVGESLAKPLRGGAVAFDAVRADGMAAVVVPTGGAWADSTGRWWPTRSSIARGQAGRAVSQMLGLPLIVSGGALVPGQPPESETLAGALALGPDVLLESGARNSGESAAGIPDLLPDAGPHAVILVTSPNHIARMRSALRHQGLAVVAVLPPARPGADAGSVAFGLSDLLPSATGLKRSRAAMYEYAALAAYLASGRISWDDLG